MIYYYKILNVRQSSGRYDYKGLDTDLLVKGHQVYPFDDDTYNLCLAASTEELPATEELIRLTEEEYYEERSVIEKRNKNYKVAVSKEPTINDRVEKIENDITVLQNSLVEQQYNELMKGVK